MHYLAKYRIRRLTYDYKFSVESELEKKVACLCGCAGCRRYMC